MFRGRLGWPTILMAAALCVPVILVFEPTGSFFSEDNGGGVPPVIEYDFGLKWEGDQVAHSFLLRNDSSEDIEVVSSEISCSCLILHDMPQKIPALGRRSIDLQGDTTGKKGAYRSSLLLTYASGSQTVLTMKGEVLSFYPRRVDLGEVLRGNELLKHFCFNHPSNFDLQVEVLEPIPDGLVFSKKFASVQGKGCFDVFLGDKMKDGGFSFPVNFKTNRPEFEKCQIVFTGYIQPSVVASKSHLVFSNFNKNGGVETDFIIQSPYGWDVDIESVELIGELNVSTEIRVLDRSHQRVFVMVEDFDGGITKLVTGRLVIHTVCRGEKHEIKIELSALYP